jgi:5-formyltetrahydrofolate cyclo-ligase
MQDGSLDAKKRLRAEAVARRARAFAEHGTEAGRRLAAFGLDFIPAPAGVIVSGFSAIRDEIDPSALLTWLHSEGFRLALPVMEGKGMPLIMRAWTPGDEMQGVQWGIKEPLPDKPTLEPDVLLVPLLAFDRHGYRIGYGGGFYDRTIARLRKSKAIVTVGIAYDELKVDAVPHESYDERLDWVLTPSGPLKCSTN